ncbi:MAG: nucleotidyltransferase family protein [Rickettsiales bacterium]
MIVSAMVLAAGRGERMRPLTDTMPKPLVSVAGKPLIDWQLDLLKDAKVETAVVNVAYLGHMIEAHLETRTRPNIIISREEEALETGGGIKKALPLLGDDPFYALNGDVILTPGSVLPVQHLAQHWNEAEMDALLLLQPIEETTGYDGKGDFYLGENGSLRRRKEGEKAPYVFSGVQILHPRLFADAPKGKFSMNVLYNKEVKADGTLGRIKGVTNDGGWYHVGDMASIRLAEEKLEH